METRSAKRKKLLNSFKEPPTIFPGDNEDRISNLPDDILHQILFFLPIKSIAQISLLSKRWKNLWYSFPDLDFSTIDTFTGVVFALTSNLSKITRSSILKGSKYADQISNLIEKHSDIRILRFRAYLSFSKLNSLIRTAVKHNVQELDIVVSTNDYFNFPRSVLSSGTLRVLRLKSCNPGFRLPGLEIMKDGLRSLTSLSLYRVILHDQPSLIDLFTDSSFPLLKKLHLEYFLGLKHLKIECPVLEDLSVESCVQLQNLEISVKKLRKLMIKSCFDAYSSIKSAIRVDAPELETLIWSYNAIIEEIILRDLSSLNNAFIKFLLHGDLNVAKIPSLLNFLTGISSCYSLSLESQGIEILSNNHLFEGVSLCLFQKLKILDLTTDFERNNKIGLARLFRSCPVVHTIVISNYISYPILKDKLQNKDLWELTVYMEERYWESQAQSLKSFLHHLKVVMIHGFMECPNVVALVKFLLKHGEVLQEVFLHSSMSKQIHSVLREKIKSDIMEFPRASSNANIVFKCSRSPWSKS